MYFLRFASCKWKCPLVYHRAKFDALTQIAQHPVLAKRMRSLFYIVDRLKNLTYEEWVEKRVTGEPLNTSEYIAETIDEEDETETVRQAVRAANEARTTRLAAVPEKDL